MARKSVIDKLPPAIQEEIGKLRKQGRSIDEILAKLREINVDVARSTMGRHVKKIDTIGAKLAETRQIADALVAKFGEREDNKMLQLNIELMMPAIMNLLVAEDGEDVHLDAEGAMFLATALQRLSKAQSDDTARHLKERTEFAKSAAKNVETVAKARGLDRDTVQAIRAAILGVDLTPENQKPALTPAAQ